jgi:hypothetical protein
MAAELVGLILSGGMLLAATTFGSSETVSELDSSLSQSTRALFNEQYTASLVRPDTFRLAASFDGAFSLLQRVLLAHDIASTVVDGVSPALDIDLSIHVAHDDKSLEEQREKVLFTALVKAGVVLCPGGARFAKDAGHFFATVAVASESDCQGVALCIVEALRTFTGDGMSVPPAKKARVGESMPVSEVLPVNTIDYNVINNKNDSQQQVNEQEQLQLQQDQGQSVTVEDESDMDISVLSKQRRPKKDGAKKKRKIQIE